MRERGRGKREGKERERRMERRREGQMEAGGYIITIQNNSSNHINHVLLYDIT